MPGPPPDFWNTRYAGSDAAYGLAPNDVLASVAARLPVGRTLCLAEGQGRNAVFLAGLGHDVLAVDQSAVGLAQAEALAASCGVRLDVETADLGVFGLGTERWDCIVSVFAHTPSDVRRRVHRAVAGALRPGGAFVLEAYTPAQTARDTGGPGPGAEDIAMTAAGLAEEVAGLCVEVLRETEREVYEGAFHTGAASVVQMLAWKEVGTPVL